MEEQPLSGSLPLIGQETISRSFTSIQKDDFLKNYQKESNTPSIGSREATQEIDYLQRANWGKAYRYEDQIKNQITYTIPLISEGVEDFGNLVIVKTRNETNSYVIKYIPEEKWLDTKIRRQGFGNFSGTIQLITLDGEIFSESGFDEGVLIHTGNSSARVAGCTTEIVVTGYTTACVDGQCIISEIRYAEVETCDNEPPGGGGGGGSGGNGSGGVGGGPGGSPTLGSPGQLDPEDIAYWLRPLKAGDDLNNPYDGMQAIATDGTTYTYDAQVNGWLMPDVTVFEEQGFTANFFNFPNFDGGIISSIGLTVSQGAARTPIGKIMVGFLTFNLWLYSIYEMSTEDRDSGTRDHCRLLFEQCVDDFGYKNLPCSTCLQFCNTQGYWDFDNCGLNHY